MIKGFNSLYCIANNVFTPYQSGFIKGESTTYQLLDLYNKLCEAVDSGKEVQSDVIEAFNSTSRYMDDLLNIDNNFFDSMVNRIYLQNFS